LIADIFIVFLFYFLLKALKLDTKDTKICQYFVVIFITFSPFIWTEMLRILVDRTTISFTI